MVADEGEERCGGRPMCRYNSAFWRQRHVGPAHSMKPKNKRHAVPPDWVVKGCNFVEGYRGEESPTRLGVGVVVVFSETPVRRQRDATILMFTRSTTGREPRNRALCILKAGVDYTTEAGAVKE